MGSLLNPLAASAISSPGIGRRPDKRGHRTALPRLIVRAPCGGAMSDIANGGVPIGEAIHLVGVAKYGGEWIGRLSEREQRLIDRYVERRQDPHAGNMPASITPGATTYMSTAGGHAIPGVRYGSPLADEIELASDRRDWCREQYDFVWLWLKRRGVGGSDKHVDRALLTEEMAKAFPALRLASPSEGQPQDAAVIAPRVEAKGAMTPLPPSVIPLKTAVGITADQCAVASTVALAMLVDAMCDGRLEAWGGWKGEEPRRLSNQFWIEVKYKELEIELTRVEVETLPFFQWLGVVPPDWQRSPADRGSRDETPMASGPTAPEISNTRPESPNQRKPIPKKILHRYIAAIKDKGGPIPAADTLCREIENHFSDYRVTREDVRAVHKEVFGELRPGRRQQSAS